MSRIALAVLLCAAAGIAQSEPTPPGCVGSLPLGRFRLNVSRLGKNALSVTDLTMVPAGSKLVWEPVRLSQKLAHKGEIAALVVPRTHGNLLVLPARKARQRTEWDLPNGADVIALVLGPEGLSMGKVKSLIANNEDLLTQLAIYAQQTSQVESLIQALANSEQTGGGADAALRGFSSAWGVNTPRLDPKAPTEQQASTLLAAVIPAAGNYDPLAPSSAQIQQTGGLAASVAGLFFGNPVALAAGGAALVSSLKVGLFPGTEFRSAFAQSAGPGVLAFCAKTGPPKPHTRTAYLWAYKVPDLPKPTESLTGPSFVPLGSKMELKVRPGEGSNVKELARARDWRLVPVSGGASSNVAVTPGGADSVVLDLSKSKAGSGDYHLTADWDWETLTLGTVHLRPYTDLSHVEVTPASRDRLIQGSGLITIQLTGADFEFVNKVELQKVVARPAKPVPTTFELPAGAQSGVQMTMGVDIDTASPGTYRLLLSQSTGPSHAIPVTVLPPNPTLSALPVRVNTGEKEVPVRFGGTGMDRVESVSSEAGAMSGAVADGSWEGKLRLKTGAKVGERFPLTMKVAGLDTPVVVPDAIVVVGPRPHILSARRSLLQDSGIEIRDTELPAGNNVGFVISVARLDDPSDPVESRPRLALNCRSGDLRRPISLSPDEPARGVTLSAAGADSLYLSLDPGKVGYPGCELTATITVPPRGDSDSFVLGRVVRLPALEKFTLTSEAAGPNRYVGLVQGRDLDLIDKAGWDAQNGLPVAGIPTPISPSQQELRLVLPWPAPAPHAPLYIWLRGETAGRRTNLAE